MRLTILASPFDRVADGVALRVEASGGVVARYSLEQLAAARWHHRLGVAGVATEVALAGETVMTGDVVLNRLRYEPTLLYTRMAATDRDYARAEFHALVLSWLAGMGTRVIGRPAPSGLGGVALGGWQWLAAAAAAGFATYPAFATTSARRAPPAIGHAPWPDLLPGAADASLDLLGFDRPRAHGPEPAAQRRITIIGDHLVGAEDPVLAAPAIRLAREVAADLLLLELAQVPGDPQWRFVTATSMPETLEAPALDALVAWLGARA